MSYSRGEPGAGKPPARICEGKAEWPSYSTTIVSLKTASSQHLIPAGFFVEATAAMLTRSMSCERLQYQAYFNPLPFRAAA